MKNEFLAQALERLKEKGSFGRHEDAMKAAVAAALDDILVERGILADDNSRIVAGHDGTRVLYDSQNPGTEIYITKMEENT